MHLYRFTNPSAEAADRCVIYLSNNRLDAIHAYLGEYYPTFRELMLSKDFDDASAILVEESFKKFEDGRVVFNRVFSIKIS